MPVQCHERYWWDQTYNDLHGRLNFCCNQYQEFTCSFSLNCVCVCVLKPARLIATYKFDE